MQSDQDVSKPLSRRDALGFAQEVGGMGSGGFDKFPDRLHGGGELLAELGVFLILPRVAEGAEARLEGGGAVLEILVEALEFFGETPDFLGIHDGLADL